MCLGLSRSRLLRPPALDGAWTAVLINGRSVVSFVFYKRTMTCGLIKRMLESATLAIAQVFHLARGHIFHSFHRKIYEVAIGIPELSLVCNHVEICYGLGPRRSIVPLSLTHQMFGVHALTQKYRVNFVTCVTIGSEVWHRGGPDHPSYQKPGFALCSFLDMWRVFFRSGLNPSVAYAGYVLGPVALVWVWDFHDARSHIFYTVCCSICRELRFDPWYRPMLIPAKMCSKHVVLVQTRAFLNFRKSPWVMFNAGYKESYLPFRNTPLCCSLCKYAWIYGAA